MLKTADKANQTRFTSKIGGFLHFLCGFLAATSLFGVPLYADKNEFTASESKLLSPLGNSFNNFFCAFNYAICGIDSAKGGEGINACVFAYDRARIDY